MRVSDLDILILPGLGGSGPDHWQSRWAQKLSTARIVEQKDWLRPERDAWIANILREIDAAARPVALVGHSLGAISAA
ncbi:RBBP9/YdeN family alpha/beta hydrolase, partial [Rhodoblastus sp.]|uniref:RBBP9/YdeN family alpha/beta hydrolase n=1 Tax=Rhodoblastus sp. TaxID=1962975 RepID=UPI0035B0443A